MEIPLPQGNDIYLYLNKQLYRPGVDASGNPVVYDISTDQLDASLLQWGQMSVGSNNAVFNANNQGIFLGNAVFGSAPFQVSMAGTFRTGDPIDNTKAVVYDGSNLYVNGTPYMGIYMVASEDLLNSNDSSKTSAAAVYTKVKETQLAFNISNVLRVKFTLNSSIGNTSYGKIYVNGVATGAEHSVVGNSPTQFSDDISGLKINDLVQVYVYTV